MIELTLYKNCILNETYTEVMSLGKRTDDENSVLEDYLSSLNHMTITINEVYYENIGEFVLDYDYIVAGHYANIYMYNYMRIKMYDENQENLLLTRYCFIDKIEIKNGCVYLSYKEDIWSSYSNEIKGITNSYLKSSRFYDYVNLPIRIKELPVDYQSDKNILIERLNDANAYVIYMEIQYYKLTTQGETTERYTHVYKLEFAVRLWEWVNVNIQRVVTAISEGYISSVNTNIQESDKYKFEVGNIYVVPSYIQFNLNEPSSDDIYIFNKLDAQICHCRKLAYSNQLYVGYLTDIPSNYKNILIGTFSSQIEFKNLGRECSLIVYTSASEIDISINLSFQNQILDITDNFRYEMPYQNLRSAEVIQEKIARQLKFKQINTAQVSNVGDWLEHLVSFNYATIGSRFMEAINLGMTEGDGSYHEYAKSALSVPQYSYSQGNFKNNTNFLDCYLGICIFRINSVNDDFVKKYINNYGYNVYEFIDNWNLLELSNLDNYYDSECNFNVIKFEKANVYGGFPREIARQLNSILENGVKIWFNSSLLDDNYVV